ncbi:MAG: polyprenyl synthetase family protein [Prevotella sp.]|nr:polyprenyl synthetase family protein [Prevotella sp.]MBR1526058.1 polyprenyl synthetase family protein [Prevotella sp.]
MNDFSLIRKPISDELKTFANMFDESLSQGEGLLDDALTHIRQRGGKRMRPILTMLIAKCFGDVNDVTQNAALGLELLHTASLVHDDVVDESTERRGQASVNASYNNKVAVLVGDYILSTALQRVSLTKDSVIINALAELGRTLSKGEILQLTNFENDGISEEIYYKIIESKTASLFKCCAEMGAISAHAGEEQIAAAMEFGRIIGIIFQIRDDIFDYYDSKEIGKPTGNDMAEGKITLPAIFALNKTQDKEMLALAKKVKNRSISIDEITVFIEFTKKNGGIEYAEEVMEKLHAEALSFVDKYVDDSDIANALRSYLDYIIERKL